MRRLFLFLSLIALAIVTWPPNAWAPTIITRGTLSAGGFGFATANAPCAGGTVTWLTNCSGTVAALSSGVQTGVTNTATGFTGSVSETCNNGTLSQSGASCTASCGGTLVGGYCWYAGGFNSSCATACGSHGGYNSATQTYAGSSGSDANCTSVASALGWSGFHGDNAVPGWGCYQATGGNVIRATLTTSSSANNANVNRACACNN